MSIHNLAYQGRFSYRLFEASGLPVEAWNMEGVEFYNSFNLLKAGIAYADKITTVSPSYAEEIMTPKFGYGLEGILARRRNDLVGILNETNRCDFLRHRRSRCWLVDDPPRHADEPLVDGDPGGAPRQTRPGAAESHEPLLDEDPARQVADRKSVV